MVREGSRPVIHQGGWYYETCARVVFGTTCGAQASAPNAKSCGFPDPRTGLITAESSPGMAWRWTPARPVPPFRPLIPLPNGRERVPLAPARRRAPSHAPLGGPIAPAARDPPTAHAPDGRLTGAGKPRACRRAAGALCPRRGLRHPRPRRGALVTSRFSTVRDRAGHQPKRKGALLCEGPLYGRCT